MPNPDGDLEAAYALETPEDNRALYATWAQTYDAGFALDMDYQLPRLVALVLAEVAQGAGPVLDVGAGTGLVAQNMVMRGEVDGLDISTDMLAVAATKGLYARTIVGDLTGALDLPDGHYGAWFVLAVNAEHFEARGFAAKFTEIGTQIEGLEHRQINIYGAGADDAHAGDLAHVAVFQKR
jgi:SAM-dependent methyltransferase